MSFIKALNGELSNMKGVLLMFTCRFKYGFISIYYKHVFVANVDNWTEAEEEEQLFLEKLKK